MRAIDADALIAQILNEMRRYNYDETRILTLASVIKMVDELPTIIEAEEVEEAEESDDCLTNFLIAIAKEREKDETIGEVKIGNYRVIGNRFSQVWRYEPEGDKE